MTLPAFTCLLPVYDGDRAVDLSEALETICANGARPARVIVCEDGDLRPDLIEVIETFAARLPLTRHRNPGPPGLHHNLNAALPQVKTAWLCRADADDLNAADRFETQLRFLADHPEVDALGSDIEEFFPDRTTRSKPMPQDHLAIVRYARLRNPLNHPTVFLRTAAVRAAGGYPDIPRREDYGLWLKMMAAGARFANIPRPLVRMRLGGDFHVRRAAGNAFKVEFTLLRLKLAAGFPPLVVFLAFLLRALSLGSSWTSAVAYSRLR